MKKIRTLPDKTQVMIRALMGCLELLMFVQVYFWVGDFPQVIPGENSAIVCAIAYGLLTMFLFVQLEGFRFGYLKCGALILSQLLALLTANGITYLLSCLLAADWLPLKTVLLLTGMDALLLLLFCAACTVLHRKLYPPRNLILVCGSQEGTALKCKMETRPDLYRIGKLIRAEGNPEDICRQLPGYDAVILGDVKEPLRSDLLKFCYAQELRVYTTAQITDILLRGGTRIDLFDTPLFLVRGYGLTVPQQVGKRLFDLAVSLLALVIAAPFMAMIAVVIKLEDGGPVFFRQKRATYGGKTFEILKFRTMVQTENGYQVTKAGAFLRDIRLDELPQLINILKGDMSIVGPRPERLEHMEAYTEQLPEFPLRLKVRGGLTGYAQIYGKYNTSAYDKLCMDLEYIENYSFLGDLKLILLTLRVLFQKESTEGFDKSRELEARTRQIWEELEQ